jgi:hypothetical protein
MDYIVSHRINYEPSGHKDFPDKHFKSLEEAQAYYNKQRERCLKKAEKIMKEFPRLYSSDAEKKDLFCDLPQDCLENHLYWGDIASFDFRDNYSIHTWELQYEEDFED